MTEPFRVAIDGHNKGDTVLGSQWLGLSRHLIASFYQVAKNEQGAWESVPGPTVKAPLTEASMEVVLNWTSPFEDAGVGKGIPTISDKATSFL